MFAAASPDSSEHLQHSCCEHLLKQRPAAALCKRVSQQAVSCKHSALVPPLLLLLLPLLLLLQVDLDLGNYERFLDITLTRDNNLTTGKVYQVWNATDRTQLAGGSHAGCIACRHADKLHWC
jgi:hypothetical protein